MSIPDAHAQPLNQIARTGYDFATNDYFCLVDHSRCAIPRLERSVMIGGGGSRLLPDNSEHVLPLEGAASFASEAALNFSSGFAAGSAIFSTVPALITAFIPSDFTP